MDLKAETPFPTTAILHSPPIATIWLHGQYMPLIGANGQSSSTILAIQLAKWLSEVTSKMGITLSVTSFVAIEKPRYFLLINNLDSNPRNPDCSRARQ